MISKQTPDFLATSRYGTPLIHYVSEFASVAICWVAFMSDSNIRKYPMSSSRLIGFTASIARAAIVVALVSGCSATKREYPASDAGTGGDSGEFTCKPACSGTNSLCDPVRKECVQCLTDEACPDPAASACVAGDCTPCAIDSECAHISGKNVCKTSGTTDAGAGSSDAGAAPGTCVQCADSSDCPSANPVCNESTNSCVGCLTANDCTDGKAAACKSQKCTACQSDADCLHLLGKEYCNAGACVKPTARNISLGTNHTCALLTNGTVKCWGYNASGQLGNGTTLDSVVPILVTGLSQATKVSAGLEHSCAVCLDGTAQCWGSNEYGNLGNPIYTIGSSLPVAVMGVSQAVAISASGAESRGAYRVSHTCALLSGGSIQCWGSNNFGELGDNSTANSDAPVTVANITQVSEIASGGTYSCARLGNNTVQCWGANGNGQLGNGTNSDSLTPTAVSYLTGAQAISSGTAHSCVAAGAVYCWGINNAGQLGDGSTTDSNIPVAVGSLSQVTSVAAGSRHSCALIADGTIQCWGDNFYGQLGNGTTTGGSRVAVLGLSQAAVAISAGSGHTCAILNDGTVQCWGDNSYGQLGTGNKTGSLVPIAVNGL